MAKNEMRVYGDGDAESKNLPKTVAGFMRV